MTTSNISTSVKPALAYYKNKTITIVDWASTGSFPDLQARFLCPYIASYLHASCNVHRRCRRWHGTRSECGGTRDTERIDGG